jgi:hypothetical protein
MYNQRLISPTFNHPFQFKLPGIKCPLDPFLLPGKKLDKFHGSDQLIEDLHAFITSSRDSFLNSDTSARDIAIQWPTNDEDYETGEGTPSKKPSETDMRMGDALI